MKEKIVQAVIDFISKNDFVTYADLEQIFYKNGLDFRGKFEIRNAEDENIIQWGGWNQEAIDLFLHMKSEEIIYVHPCDEYYYFAADRYPNLPVTKDIRKSTAPHWMPLCFKTKWGG